MNHPAVDDSRFPLVITTVPEGARQEDFEAILKKHSEILGRRERYVTITDTSAVTSIPSATERRFIADWNQAHEAQMRRYNVGSALVIQSPLVRGALTALNWLFRPPTPWVNTASLPEALAWCVGKLEAEGIFVPATVRELERELHVA